METPWYMWASFFSVVMILMVLDLGVLHRRQREIGAKESMMMCGGYMTVACLFGIWVWSQLGAQAGKEYFTGYIIEQTLSMDNMFVISMIFTYFNIPKIYRHRVLFWGIIGVIVFRGIMITVGAAAVEQYSWILYVFAVFLVLTGIKMFRSDDKPMDIEHHPILKLLRKVLPITKELHGEKFAVRLVDEKTGKYKRYFTPLFLALCFVEFVDVIFAVDSIPAIFAITTDPYIVYTCNIFAVLGLRALYFALESIIHRFHYLKYSLAVVLIFIGSKIFIADLMDMEKFPVSISLSVTIALIAAGIGYSLYKTRNQKSAT